MPPHDPFILSLPRGLRAVAKFCATSQIGGLVYHLHTMYHNAPRHHPARIKWAHDLRINRHAQGD